MRPAIPRILFSMTMLAALNAGAQSYAGPHELNICTIPQRILIASENVGFPSVYYRVQRWVQYPGQPLTKLYAQPGYPTAKNWAMSFTAAPQQAQNCSNGGPWGTQWLAFRIKTSNYFGSGVVDHLVFGLRSSVTSTSYDALGIIFMPVYGGIMGERFRFGIDAYTSVRQDPAPQPQMPLQDGMEYAVQIHATKNYTAYQVTNVTTGYAQEWRGFANPPGYPELNTGSGLFFAVLCSGTPGQAHCDNYTSTPFSVDIWGIASGWM